MAVLALAPIPNVYATGEHALPSTPVGPAAVVPDFRVQPIPPPTDGKSVRLEYATADAAYLFIETEAYLGPGDEKNNLYELVAGRAIPVVRGSTGRASLDDATPDVRYKVVRSNSRLTTDDTDLADDLFRVGPDGNTLITNGPDDLLYHVPAMVSDDGATIVFTATASLAPADSDTQPDLYRWNSGVATLELLTPGTAEDFTLLAMSSDGSRVLIQTDEALTGEPIADGIYDADGSGYVFRGAGLVRRISPSLDRVFLTSYLALTPDDIDDEVDAYASTDDGMTLLTRLDDHGTGAGLGNFGAFDATGTRFLVNTSAQLTPDDLDTTGDVYRSDHGVLTLVSAGDADASSLTMTENGRFVVYVTKAALDPLDTDEFYDLYRWDVEAPDQPVLLTLGDGYNGSEALAINESGETVVIHSGDPLLPEDTNGVFDVYVWHKGTLSLISPVPDKGGRLAFASTDLRRLILYASGGLFAVDFDVIPPTATLSAIASSTTSRSAAFQAGSVGADAIWFDCRLDGGPWLKCGPKVTVTGLIVGKHKLELRAFEAAANESAPATRSWTVLASTDPSIDTGGPRYTIASGTSLVSGKAPIRLTWTSAGLASVGDRYELAESTNGGAWKTISTSLTSKALTMVVVLGYDHRFRVRTIGPTGNVGAWATGRTFRMHGYDEATSTVTYAGTWTTTTSTAYWGGKARTSSRAGAKATFRFLGRNAAIVSRLGPGRGKAEIWVGSTRVATIDLYSATYSSQRVVWSRTWTTSILRNVTIKNLGTPGRPRVEFDGFFVGS